MKTWKKFRKENINEAETLSWKSLNSNERKDLLKDVRLPSSFAKDSWKDLDYRAKEILGKYINKTTQGEFRIDEAWTPDSVTRNAEIGSKKGYGINIKKGGGVTKTPFKHMLMTMQKHGNVRVTFDHGKDVFEGTPQSVALHINQILGIKESVELDEGLTLASDNVSDVKKTAQKLARQSPDRTYYVVQNTKIHGDGKMKRYEVVDSVDMHLYRQEKKIIGYGKSVKESVEEVDEVLSDREMERFTKAHTDLHTRYHKQALQIIKFIDSVAKHKDKWTDSFGDYVKPKMNPELKLSSPNTVEYQQGRGRGDWSFLIGHGKVRYNNSNMPWKPKSGELPFDKFMKLLDTWKKETLKESVELDEESHWVLSIDFHSPEYTSKEGRAIQNDLDKKFKSYSGSGSGGSGWDCSFNGSKKELEKAKKYVETKYKKFIDDKHTQLYVDESVEHIATWNDAAKLQEKYETDKRIPKMSDKGKELLAWMANSFEMTGGPHLDKKNVHGLSRHAVDGIVKKLKSLKGLPADKKKDMALVMKELGEGIEEEISTTTTSVGTLTDPTDMGKKKKKRCTELDKYTDSQIFTVSSEDFNRCSTGRRKNERWSKFFASESEQGANIKKYSLRNPKSPIIIKNEETGDMMFLRRRLNDQRLKHNKRK